MTTDEPDDLRHMADYEALDRAARDQRAIDEMREDRTEADRLAAEGREKRACSECGEFYVLDLIAARPLFPDRCPRCRALSCLACGEVAEDAMDLATDKIGCRACGAWDHREEGAA